MKYLLLAVMASSLAVGVFARARDTDPCEKAAYNFAVKSQHEDYPGAKWKESNPGAPEVQSGEKKSNGFETYGISYTVDEECLEGYDVLVRRSESGESCAALKLATKVSRDCG